MNRQMRGIMLAVGSIAVLAAGFLFARSSRHHALLSALPNISLEQFKPTARKLVSEMLDNVKKEPLRADRWGELGYALAGNGAFNEASACFARAEELEPDNYRWPHLYAYSTIKVNREPAVAALKRALQIRANVVPTIATLAEAYLEDGADKEADALLRPRVTEKTDDQHLLFEMARVEANAGAVDRAVEMAERAASMPPQRRQIHQLLAQLYQRKGEAAKSKKEERILQLLPPKDDDSIWPDAIVGQMLKYSRDIDTMAFQARQLAVQGRPDEAVQLLRQLTPEEQSSAACISSLAIAQAHLGQFKEAEQLLTTDAFKDHPNVVFADGVVASLQGKYAEGVEYYRRLAALIPEAGRAKFADGAFVNQGNCLMALKKSDEAMKAYEQALKINPGNLDAIIRLATLYLDKSRKADARRLLDDAALLQPNDESIKEMQKRAGN